MTATVMAKVQGDFPMEAAGRKAVEALTAAGVARDRIRVWKLIPEGDSTSTGGTAGASGALTGYLLGGVPGLAAGALIGSAVEAGAEEARDLPAPTGLRVVVDLPEGEMGGDEARQILASCGARNLVTLP